LNKILIFRILFFICLVVITYLAFVPNYNGLPKFLSLSDMANHFFAFFVLSFLFDFSFNLSKGKKGFILFGYAILIEVVQYYLPTRDFSVGDIIVDIGAISMYYSLEPIDWESVLKSNKFFRKFFK